MARASEWASRVEAWRASGQSASEFCAGRDFSAKNLQWWSSHLRRGSKGAARSTADGSSTGAAAQEPFRLARVVRKPEEATASSCAVVVQVGAARVEVPRGADRATLSVVFEALGMVGAAGAQ